MNSETVINPTEKPVSEAVQKRWSPRAFADQAVSKEALATLFEAARWTASSSNEQPWRFIVATKEDSAAYKKMLSVAIDWNQSWAKLAPVLILSIAKTSFNNKEGFNQYAWYDLGAAVTSLSLEAVRHDLFVHQMAGIHPDKAKELFAIPEGYEVVSLVALGYMGNKKDLPEDIQAREGTRRERKALSELVFSGKFGDSLQ